MTNPMLAELDAVVRLRDAAEYENVYGSCESFAEADKAYKDGAASFIATHAPTLADMAKRLERDAAPVSALEALLPGTYYMDPPDGGDAPVYEQLRRMAKDAARYRWLRDSSYGQHDHPICVSQNKRMLMGERIGNLYVGPLIGVALDKALDAAIDATQEGEG